VLAGTALEVVDVLVGAVVGGARVFLARIALEVTFSWRAPRRWSWLSWEAPRSLGDVSLATTLQGEPQAGLVSSAGFRVRLVGFEPSASIT